MSNEKYLPPDLRVNRRKEIFRTVRGSKLTQLRGRSTGESGGQSAGSPRRAIAHDDEPQTTRRVRLGPAIEDETDAPEALGVRRYSEPND